MLTFWLMITSFCYHFGQFYFGQSHFKELLNLIVRMHLIKMFIEQKLFKQFFQSNDSPSKFFSGDCIKNRSIVQILIIILDKKIWHKQILVKNFGRYYFGRGSSLQKNRKKCLNIIKIFNSKLFLFAKHFHCQEKMKEILR